MQTKTDDKQLPIGQFLELNNSVFTKGGLLQKRNGYGYLPELGYSSSPSARIAATPSVKSSSPSQQASFLTTFNENLSAVGTQLQALSTSYGEWVQKGRIQPIELNVSTLIRNNTNQTQVDAAIAPNGLMCTVYTDQSNSNTFQPVFRYTVSDSETGQNIIPPTNLPYPFLLGNTPNLTPKVFVLGSYFVILFVVYNSVIYNLEYIAISTSNPNATSGPTLISNSVTPSTQAAFDAAVLNNALYIAWNGQSTSGIKITYLTQTLTQANTVFADPSHSATNVSVCTDVFNQNIWVNYYNSNTNNSYCFVTDVNLHLILSPTATLTGVTLNNLTATANGGNCVLLTETANTYSYDNNLSSNFLQSTSIASTGTVGTPQTFIRSVGLASKAFLYNDTTYALAAYQSPYQSTYFLIDQNGNTLSKVAYGNGNGYVTQLPNVSLNGTEASVPYLLKTLIQAANTNTNIPSGSQTAAIYSQVGINLAQFTFDSLKTSVLETGNNLNLTGGLTWAYDGFEVTELGFHLYPDSVEAATQADPALTGTVTSGSPYITVITPTGVGIGMTVAGTDIPSNTTVLQVFTTSVLLSKNATGNNTGTYTFTGNQPAQKYFYQVTYEWQDNQGNLFRSAPSIPVTVTTSSGNSSAVVNIPLYRITAKTSNPVKIVVYRWSTAQLTYYQTTSIQQPILNLNLTSQDSITFIDGNSDANILGNNILYTNGGVLENIGPPAFDNIFSFDDRLFGITSENKNLLWYSQKLIQNVPVETSDLLTLFIAPNTGIQSTGPLKCGFQMDDKAILFKETGISFINGTGPDSTGSNSQYSEPIFITSTVGCSNSNSLILIPTGLMFEFTSQSGGNQIWMLTRDLQTLYIGAPMEAITQNATVQSAVNIPGTNSVRFTLSSGVTLNYDYYYNQWDTFSNVKAISSTLFQGLHTYLDPFNNVLQETPGQYLDGTSPVLMNFLTGWLKLGDLQGYQRAYFFYFLGSYFSPHRLVIQIAYDYNPIPVQQSIITPQNFSGSYGTGIYGSQSPYGGGINLEQWKIFFERERCMAFQISVQEQYDPSFAYYGGTAGKGLTISGINCQLGFKKGYRPIKISQAVG
jgi:hypothetical protein